MVSFAKLGNHCFLFHCATIGQIQQITSLYFSVLQLANFSQSLFFILLCYNWPNWTITTHYFTKQNSANKCHLFYFCPDQLNLANNFSLFYSALIGQIYPKTALYFTVLSLAKFSQSLLIIL
jgi:hypothetical protein